jgi:hypothetical protein
MQCSLGGNGRTNITIGNCSRRGFGIALFSIYNRKSRPCISSPKSATARLVSSSKRRLDLEWDTAYHHESYQAACRGMNGVIITPLVQARLIQCTSLSLCLLTRLCIYILFKGRYSIDIDRHRLKLTIIGHHDITTWTKTEADLNQATCRRKSNKTWPETTRNTPHRSLQAI